MYYRGNTTGTLSAILELQNKQNSTYFNKDNHFLRDHWNRRIACRRQSCSRFCCCFYQVLAVADTFNCSSRGSRYYSARPIGCEPVLRGCLEASNWRDQELEMGWICRLAKPSYKACRHANSGAVDGVYIACSYWQDANNSERREEERPFTRREMEAHNGILATCT